MDLVRFKRKFEDINEIWEDKKTKFMEIGKKEAVMFPENLSDPWSPELFEKLLLFLKGCGMSDLLLTSERKPQCRIDGVWMEVSNRVLSKSNIEDTLGQTSGNRAAASLIYSGLDMDYSFEVGLKRSERIRFRANAVGVSCGWGSGISLTFRLIPGAPPTLEELSVERDLLPYLFPESGLVLFTGVMGSGKSTFLASVMRRILEKGGRHICTYEAPLEFDLGKINGALGPCEQSEVPKNVENFGRAVRNLTRRAADVVLVGESRDPETMRGVLQAAELGVAVYTTAHTRGVSDTPTRILNIFPPIERRGMSAALFSTLRLIVQQRLLARPGGGRFAIREYLVLDDSIRFELMHSREKDLPRILERILKDNGQPILVSAQREYERGNISEESFKAICFEKDREFK
jgi:defect-in-organelle-trafficking protein DotB